MKMQLTCPRDHKILDAAEGGLACARGHFYPVLDGIPVMLIAEAPETIGIAAESWRVTNSGSTDEDGLYADTLGLNSAERAAVRTEWSESNWKVDPVASHLVAAAGGFMYRHLRGKLKDYPIPVFPMPLRRDTKLLDVGCNWGRWSLSAAKVGAWPTGIDPSLGAVAAMKRIAKTQNLEVEGVVGDARFLPFADETFDMVYSYSVLQHFAKDDARLAFAEMARVLKPGGTLLVQMPLKTGVRCLYHQLRRGFREPRGFEVRYWTTKELRHSVAPPMESAHFFVDCFFGIGIRPEDAGMMPVRLKAVVAASELLRRASGFLPALVEVADSVFLQATKARPGRRES
jgi:ubiquinone/menaquinone biosynthesis C-methylase UbiE/uncharacterized protein YbaR (Trm112 family)